MPPNEPLLTLNEVAVNYGKAPAVRGISITVGRGEIVTLLGANGAGKTSTLRAISGLVPISRGSITLAEESLAELSAAQIVQRGVSHVPEGRRIFPRLSVRDNLELGGYRLSRPELRQRIAEMFAMFPLLEQRHRQFAGTLSGGEQQMLAIARALMAGPKLLLLDEPSLGLAPIVVQSLFAQLKQIRSAGITVLLVEQNARLALNTADRAYVIEQGEIVCSGTAADVASDVRIFNAYLGGEGVAHASA